VKSQTRTSQNETGAIVGVLARSLGGFNKKSVGNRSTIPTKTNFFTISAVLGRFLGPINQQSVLNCPTFSPKRN